MRRGLVLLLVFALVWGCGAPAPAVQAPPSAAPPTVVPPTEAPPTEAPPTMAPPTDTPTPEPTAGPTPEPTAAPEEGEITLDALAVSDEDYLALLNLDAAIVIAQELVSHVQAGDLTRDEAERYARGVLALWESAKDALAADPVSALFAAA